jgi:hypothetical protein
MGHFLACLFLTKMTFIFNALAQTLFPEDGAVERREMENKS